MLDPMKTVSLPLHTDRLTLRPHVINDAQPLQAIYEQREVARFLLDEPWTSEVAATKVAERILRTDLAGDAGALSLVIDLDGVVIGDVMLWLTDRERGVAEIGWVLDPAYSGRGFAREAARALLDAGFTSVSLHRIAAQMDARNDGSAKLAESLGMRREAHFRQDWWNKGEWTDTVVYGILARDRDSDTGR